MEQQRFLEQVMVYEEQARYIRLSISKTGAVFGQECDSGPLGHIINVEKDRGLGQIPKHMLPISNEDSRGQSRR